MDEQLPTRSVVLLGAKFDVVLRNNYFNILRAFDDEAPANLPKYLIDSIAPHDRNRFITHMAQQGDLGVDGLFEAFAAITEAQGDGHPSSASSGSSSSSRTKRA